MNQLQTCTDNLVKVILNQLQMQIDCEYYEEVCSIKRDLDKKELTLKEAGMGRRQVLLQLHQEVLR